MWFKMGSRASGQDKKMKEREELDLFLFSGVKV
jgi:hypothetical protein